jgi:hypothetical protein
MSELPIIRGTITTLALLMSLGVVSSASAGSLAREVEALPDIAPPPGGRSFWIARAMRLNGMPLTLKAFSSTMNAEEALHHFEHRLKTSASIATQRSQEGNWRILAVFAPEYFVTIRARNEANGVQGTIAVSPVTEKSRASRRTTFPHPAPTHVVNLQQYDDEGVEAEHISFVSRRTASIEARDFAATLSRAGWQLVRNEAAHSRQGAHVIEAQKGTQLAFVNIERRDQGDTAIVVLWRKT